MLKLGDVEPFAGGVTVVVKPVPPSLHVAFVGQPVRLRFTALLKLFNELTVTVPDDVPPTPAVKLSGTALAETVKSAEPVQPANFSEPMAVLQT